MRAGHIAVNVRKSLVPQDSAGFKVHILQISVH